MTTLNLGNIRFNWRGAYDPQTYYKARDVVGYQGSSYVAVIDNSNTPVSDANAWHLMAAGTDQLTDEGDLLIHDGNIPVRLPRGLNAQVLQMVGTQPEWLDQSLDPSNKVWKLAKVNGMGGWYTRVYLMADGTIKTCGYGGNYSNGDPSGSNIYLPNRLTSEDNDVRFVDVFSGGAQHYAITDDGEVWSWGYNNYGQLGHGDTVNRPIAKRIDFFVENNIRIKRIVTGRPNYYDYGVAYFITTDGHVYACGNNSSGNLGSGTSAHQYSPVRCGSLENIVDLAVSGLPYTIFAIQDNGSLWVWGNNASGQLGLGDITNRETPILHTSISNASKAITSSGYKTDGTGPAGHSAVLLSDGTVWTCGYNGYGQLGHDDITNRTSFSQVTVPENLTDLICGDGRYPSMAAITNTTEILTWGYNAYGQLGIGNTSTQYSPLKPEGVFQGDVERAVFGGGSSYEGLILQADNRLFGCGYNGNGSLGINTGSNTNAQLVPVLGISGVIEDWNIYGQGTTGWGLGVLYSDGRVDACGSNAEPYRIRALQKFFA